MSPKENQGKPEQKKETRTESTSNTTLTLLLVVPPDTFYGIFIRCTIQHRGSETSLHAYTHINSHHPSS